MSASLLKLAHKNPSIGKADLSFGNGILKVRFTENAVVEVEDVIYIYCYGIEQSGKKPYGILFDSSSTHEFTEEAIVYFARQTLNHNILAIAYLSKDLLSKIRLNLFLIFEKPPIKPKVFSDESRALDWLQREVTTRRLIHLD